jgi:hypothetical protein
LRLFQRGARHWKAEIAALERIQAE